MIVSETHIVQQQASREGGGSLPAWRQGMDVGDWVPIPGSAPSTLVPTYNDYTELETQYGWAMATALSGRYSYCGIAIDPRDSKIYSFAGGGHGTAAAYNGVTCNDIEKEPAEGDKEIGEPSNVLEYEHNYDEGGGLPGGHSLWMDDGRCFSQHNYMLTHVVTKQNKLFSFGWGSTQGNPFYPDIVSFDLGTKQWDPMGTNDPLSGGTNNVACEHMYLSVLDPDLEDAYTFIGDVAIKWTQGAAKGSQCTILGIGPQSFNYCCGAFDTKRGHILLAGKSSSNSQAHHIMTPSGDFSTRTFVGEAATELMDGTLVGQVCQLLYSPRRDAFFLVTGRPDPTIFMIVDNDDDLTMTCTYFATSGGEDIPSQPIWAPYNPIDNLYEGVHSRARYAPRLGGIVLMTQYTTPLYFLKTEDVDGE